MRPIQRFILPDGKKTTIFVVFALILISGLVQRTPMFESPPSPPSTTPSPLGDFSFTLLAYLLSLPYLVVIFGLSLAGVIHVYNFTWPVIAGNGIYLYLLSCICVTSFNRYRNRFSKWHWTAILGMPLILIASLQVRTGRSSFSVDDLLNDLGVSLIAALYVYLLFCLGFSVYDAVIKRISAARHSAL